MTRQPIFAGVQPESGASIVRKPLPANDPARRRPNISLARLALGWEPRIGLEDGLQRTIAYFGGAHLPD